MTNMNAISHDMKKNPRTCIIIFHFNNNEVNIFFLNFKPKVREFRFFCMSFK